MTSVLKKVCHVKKQRHTQKMMEEDTDNTFPSTTRDYQCWQKCEKGYSLERLGFRGIDLPIP
jgi:hypothetical protein